MATVHSKKTVIIIDGTDVSGYCTDSTIERSWGTEDNTTYGKTDQVFDPTLRTGTFTCGGKYNDAVGGPAAFFNALVEAGQHVNVKYRSEGTGTGLPQRSFSALITKYNESAPVAGYRVWTVETQPSDAWDSTAQA